jgi:hypothetical protein
MGSGRIIVAPRGRGGQPVRLSLVLVVLSGGLSLQSSRRIPPSDLSRLLGTTIVSSQPPRKLLAAAPHLNVNIKSSTVPAILTFTFSTTTNNPAGPFLWLRRRAFSPIAQLKWQDMVRA